MCVDAAAGSDAAGSVVRPLGRFAPELPCNYRGCMKMATRTPSPSRIAKRVARLAQSLRYCIANNEGMCHFQRPPWPWKAQQYARTDGARASRGQTAPEQVPRRIRMRELGASASRGFHFGIVSVQSSGFTNPRCHADVACQ